MRKGIFVVTNPPVQVHTVCELCRTEGPRWPVERTMTHEEQLVAFYAFCEAAGFVYGGTGWLCPNCGRQQ